jgi:hypothetical protein
MAPRFAVAAPLRQDVGRSGLAWGFNLVQRLQHCSQNERTWTAMGGDSARSSDWEPASAVSLALVADLVMSDLIG